jgi:hypothetical protein
MMSQKSDNRKSSIDARAAAECRIKAVVTTEGACGFILDCKRPQKGTPRIVDDDCISLDRIALACGSIQHSKAEEIRKRLSYRIQGGCHPIEGRIGLN